jgi:hypothetical protein
VSAVKHLAVDPAVACEALGLTLGWAGGEMPVFVDGRPLPSFKLPCPVGGDLWRRAHALDERASAQVEVGLPQQGAYVGSSTVLWVWVSGRDQVFRASRFRPAPSIVLRFGAGSERLLLWPLREPAAWVSAGPANERIAYAVHAPRTRCVPERLRVPVPGTFVRVGRARPAPVLVTRLEPDDFTLGQVAGGLKAPPSRDAWRERRSA